MHFNWLNPVDPDGGLASAPMAEIVRLKPTRPCPICGKPSTQAYHPFCSARCQDVDLNRWLSGRYAIPTAEPRRADRSVPDDSKTDLSMYRRR